MAGSFADLKRSRQNSLDQLTTELTKLQTPQQNNGADDRFWKPEVDKSGNGYAVIRFLPAPQGEDMPFVRVWDHGFKGPTGKWYIEKSLTTVGQKDPVSEYNTMLWNSGIEANKQQVREQKRRLGFYSNIYVVQDPSNPQNEGKVFLYRYGKKIFDKLNEAMNPEFVDETPMNPFDLWEGANFKLKIRNVEGYRNYDKSEFGTSEPLLQDDEELEAIWNREYSLSEFVDATQFKTYDELKQKLYDVLELNTPQETARPATADIIEEAPKPMKTAEAETESFAFADDEDEESLNFFKKLAED